MDFAEGMHRLRTIFPLATEPALAETVRDLLARYTEPDRRFSTLGLLRQRLAEFDRARELCERPEVVELAVLYSRACAAPLGTVSGSGELCRQVARRFEAEPVGILAGRLIDGTRFSNPVPDQAVADDISLSVLGGTTEELAVSVRQLVEEYGARSEWSLTDWCRLLLGHSPLYAHPCFRERLEVRTRTNLVHALALFRSCTWQGEFG